MIIKYCGEFDPVTPRDAQVADGISDFIHAHDDAFGRNSTPGHVTASAFVVSHDMKQVLLTHHRKLNIWLQLGGHCDGIRDPHFVALKEAYEESGLPRIDLGPRKIFDIDIHPIPASKADPRHLHFDVRYLFFANPDDPLAITDESKDLRWVHMKELDVFTNLASVLIVREKLSSGWVS
jgi:8-oxo-dGTP pyrophosphatase MutT (NUDIX family)